MEKQITPGQMLEVAKLLHEVEENMKDGMYDFTCDGKCSGCGSCCSNLLPVSQQEIQRIKKYMKKHGIKEQKKAYPFAKPMVDMTCPFRSEKERKCLIYPVRPAICKDFQCDKPKKQIQANKDLYYGKYTAIDMRQEFFKEDI